MGFFNWARARRLSAAALGSSVLFIAVACSSSKPKPADSASGEDNGPPPACNKDEVREYLCDDLLPFNGEKAAAEPYQTCPSSVGVKGNVFKPTSGVARFDPTRTAWTRKRVPPGHACCYSWCSTLVLADAGDVDAASCQQPNAMRERLCISSAEAGVSDSAAAPNEGCAAAVSPPPSVSFTPPKAAALDLQATAEKRSQGVSECCYGWCSKAPLGTGLGAK
ncbi:MAG: hypothetical protein K0R38_4724 [Polyangiaceae bacterium]|jgi:hypothetical protein|nr:hypothetical protein [Polyangiaceae bacterium]